MMKLPVPATRRQQQTLCIVVAILSVGAFHRLYVADARVRIAVQEQALVGLDARIRGSREAGDRRHELGDRVRALELQLDALGRVLPENKDQSALLTDLHTLALASGVVVRGFKPLPVDNKPHYRAWPLSLELDATYQTLSHFLDDISKLSRLVTIDALSIKANERKSGGGPTIRVTCIASTFALDGNDSTNHVIPTE